MPVDSSPPRDGQRLDPLRRPGSSMGLRTSHQANFMSNVLQRYLDRLHVKHQTTSAYHPRSNGKCERLNGIIGHMLNKYVGTHIHSWDQYLHQSLFACRVHISQRTHVSPFQLVYGIEPRLPQDPVRPFLFDFQNENDAVEYRKKTFREIDALREKHLQTQQAAADDMVARHEDTHSITEDMFAVGDFVLVKNFGRTKLQPRWYGPLEVVRVTPLSTYQLRWGDGEVKVDLVHQDRLKKAFLPNGETAVRAWFAKTKHTMEDFHDNTDDGTPAPVLTSDEEQRVAESLRLRTENERYLARRAQSTSYEPPMMGSAEDAARTYRAALAASALPSRRSGQRRRPQMATHTLAVSSRGRLESKSGGVVNPTTFNPRSRAPPTFSARTRRALGPEAHGVYFHADADSYWEPVSGLVSGYVSSSSDPLTTDDSDYELVDL